jgi:hypothetical protein
MEVQREQVVDTEERHNVQLRVFQVAWEPVQSRPPSICKTHPQLLL